VSGIEELQAPAAPGRKIQMGLRVQVLAAWLGLVSALGGCGGHAQLAEDPPTLERACNAWEQSACEAFQRCAPENFGNRYPDVAGCVSVRERDCIERTSAPGNTVLPAQVQACAQATKDRSCSAVVSNEFGLSEPDPACVWPGTLAEGEACIASSQCSTAACSFYGQEACGTCVTRADTDCLLSSECLVGSLCIDGQCVVSAKRDEGCDFDFMTPLRLDAVAPAEVR